MRQVVLDTETTGLEPEAGHRIIEIGCIELVNRRTTGERFHHYLNPGRGVEAGAEAVHGIDDEFLADKPRFYEVAEAFLDFIRGAELIIHNAEFDIGFLNHELQRVPELSEDIRTHCTVLDTLNLARQKHPGQRNSLDALCKRYGVDNSRREVHGALLDAHILAEVFLAMTGGQAALLLGDDEAAQGEGSGTAQALSLDGLAFPVIPASEEEIRAHDAFLARMEAERGKPSVWQALAAGTPAQVA